MGGYTGKNISEYVSVVVICLQISNFEWVDTPKEKNYTNWQRL